MDINISWSKKKLRRRNGNNRRNDRGVDRISDLPDCLLEQILSNLDVKVAIKMSLISRRWRHLWTRVPSLKFIFHRSSIDIPLRLKLQLGITTLGPHSNWEFIPDFVNNVFNRRGACEIDKFEFRCDVVSDHRFLDSMMSHVMSLNVKEVKLHVTKITTMHQLSLRPAPGPVYLECNWQLPECLCANKSLKKLELCTQLFNTSMRINSFLTLKELRLCGLFNSLSVRGTTSKIAPWQELCTTQCPVLESLSFSKCFCPDFDLQISSPLLKHLEILDSRFDRVIVSSPLLAYFKFEGLNIKSIAIDDRAFLEEVEMDFEVNGSDLKEMLVLFLRRLQKAKSFAISWTTYEGC